MHRRYRRPVYMDHWLPITPEEESRVLHLQVSSLLVKNWLMLIGRRIGWLSPSVFLALLYLTPG